MDTKLRSDIEFGVAWAERRALLKGLGKTDADLKKPQIAIINSWSDINPGHIHLADLAKYVENGIIEAGGQPYNFNTIGLCDGIALVGAEYILPSRDLIKSEVEVLVESYKMDAMVLLATCDKIVPAYAMAVAALDIPAIIVTGGYMENGQYKGKAITFCDVGRAVGATTSNKISMEECTCIINNACKMPGACGMMGTANTMCIVAEALGLTIPGNSSVAAKSDEIKEIAYKAGKQIVELWKSGIKGRNIITREAIRNAYIACMAVGGSTNAMIHIPAIATCAELDIDCLEIMDQCSLEVPLLVGIEPNGPFTMEEFDRDGGLQAVFKALEEKISSNAQTIMMKSMGELVQESGKSPQGIIHTLNDPISDEGALAVLRGNIAPDGAMIKQSAVPTHMMKFSGPARVFDCNKDAVEGLRSNKIKEGDVVVIRFCGAKGAPGVVTTFMFTSELAGSSLNGKVALITDGRFSGATEGACIGYISPEAALRGPLLAVQDGDIVEYDIQHRKLNVLLSDEEIARRIKEFDLNIEIKKGYMGIYQKTVGSLLKGAVLSGLN